MNFEDELSALSHFEEQKSMIDYTKYTTVEDQHTSITQNTQEDLIEQSS